MASTSFPKNRIRIVLTENIHPHAATMFKSQGYSSIETLKGSPDAKWLNANAGSIHLLGIRSKTFLDAAFFNNAGRLISVGCYCIGTNQVDMNAALKNGVAVFNSPYSNTRSVAELVIAHCIHLLRKIPSKNFRLHQGKWEKSSTGCHELRGKTIGIAGYGHIGSQVSVLAESLGMKVIFYDLIPKLILGNASQSKSLDELLSRADIVTLHIPGSASNKNLINAQRLKKMKKHSILINLSRGDVVDLDALKLALKEKHLSGAAIDVFPYEPKANNEIFTCPLQGMDNVILTPHIGGSTEEAQQQIAADVTGKMLNLLESGNSTGSHSLPEIALPVQRQTHRLLHIHQNIPGVLGEINSRLSKNKINILGQYLNTNSSIGYVALDMDKKFSGQALEELKKVKGTIRVRTLY
jgi:D-3-phosphoglycerate dehydrogenase